ncbi:High mobility group protein B1 [Plecturocebus cupreus]
MFDKISLEKMRKELLTFILQDHGTCVRYKSSGVKPCQTKPGPHSTTPLAPRVLLEMQNFSSILDLLRQNGELPDCSIPHKIENLSGRKQVPSEAARRTASGPRYQTSLLKLSSDWTMSFHGAEKGEHKKKHPAASVNFSEFSKKCSEKQKTMSATEKGKYEDMGKVDRAR